MDPGARGGAWPREIQAQHPARNRRWTAPEGGVALGRAGGAPGRAAASVLGPGSEESWGGRWGGVRKRRASFRRGQGLRNLFGVGCSVLLLLAGCRPRSLDPQPKTILAVFAHPDDEIFVGPLL